VSKSQLIGSFCKQIVPLLTEHDDVIEMQTNNCVRSQIAHATPLLCTVGRKISFNGMQLVTIFDNHQCRQHLVKKQLKIETSLQVKFITMAPIENF